MPVCPECRTDQKKRVANACPNCHVQVESWKGHWFRGGTGSPTENILLHFEEWVSRSLSQGRQTRIPFAVPRMSTRYRRELVSAERILRLCDWDIDLVKETIDFLFTDRQFSWKTRNTLLWIDTDFTAAMAIAKANREMKAQKVAEEQKAVQNILRRQDIFNS